MKRSKEVLLEKQQVLKINHTPFPFWFLIVYIQKVMITTSSMLVHFIPLFFV